MDDDMPAAPKYTVNFPSVYLTHEIYRIFKVIQLGEFLIKMNSDCLHSFYKQNTKFIGF